MEQVVILMSAYRGGNYLREQLDSILRQDYGNWHLFVSDDCSGDATLSLLESYANAYPGKITLRNNPVNLGATESFLTLLQDAGEACKPQVGQKLYFMFSDQDDIWHPDKISRTLRRMKQLEKHYGAEKPLLVYTDAAMVDENKKMLSESFGRMQHLNIANHRLNHLLMENACQGCTMMLNYALAKKVRIPGRGVRYHDWWVAMIAETFGHAGFLPEATMDYRLHGTNVVGADNFAAYAKKRAQERKKREDALLQTYVQGRVFWECYGDEITDMRKKQLVREFAALADSTARRRLCLILKNRFFKSGFVRNLGLIFTVIFQK